MDREAANCPVGPVEWVSKRANRDEILFHLQLRCQNAGKGLDIRLHSSANQSSPLFMGIDRLDFRYEKAREHLVTDSLLP